MAAKRRYSDSERATALAALAANGGNLDRTAKALGIPFTTLKQWADGTRHPEASQMSEQKKEDMAAALEEVAWKLLRSLESKIDTAPLSQAATSMGIAIDKARLLRGEPTTISEATTHVDLSKLSDKELDDAERLALKAAGSRRDQAREGAA